MYTRPSTHIVALLCTLFLATTAMAQETPADATSAAEGTTEGTTEGAGDGDGTEGSEEKAGASLAKAAVDGIAPVDPLSLITVVPGGPPARTPMAVATPVLGVGESDPDDIGGSIEEVLRRDFEMSGLFEVTSADSYALVDVKTDGLTVSTIDFDGWFNVGAAVLIKGLYKVEGDQVEIDLRLFSVDEGREISLNWSPTTVKKGSVRRPVHDFVNAVIEYYTGEPGVFGTRILFVGPDTGSDRTVYSIENDGFGLYSYDIPAGINVLPTWGPGGAVFFTRLDKEGDFLMSFKDEEMEQLTDSEGFASGADYCRKKGLVAFTASTEESPEIFVMNEDGTDLRQVTNAVGSIETSPSWAPGCKQIAFVSDRTGHPQIYVMNADGSGERRLTWVGNYNTTPDWSPKGDQIAFTARDERRRFDIFTVSVAGGEITRLTQDQGNNEEPSWAPDGRYLAFQSTRDGRQPRLYMMTADGRWQTRISKGIGYRTPVWQR